MQRIPEGSETATTAAAVVGPSLDELARAGARRMLVAALEAEVADYVARFGAARDERGHAEVVRNGHGRARKVTVGAGTLEVQAPRVDDRRVVDGAKQTFRSRVLPPYVRRSPKVAEVLALLYLHGLSTSDFQPALAGLLGEDAAGLARWVGRGSLADTLRPSSRGGSRRRAAEGRTRGHDHGAATARPATDHPSAESTRGPSFAPETTPVALLTEGHCCVPRYESKGALAQSPSLTSSRVLQKRASIVMVSRAFDLPRAGRRAGPTCPPATYIAARSA